MQLKDVKPIIKAILEERDKIPRIIDQERYIPNPQPYHDGNLIRGGIRKALRAIEQAPVADAVPVVHAVWEYCKYPGGTWWCSSCAGVAHLAIKTPYCPHCGAKMDGNQKANG